MENTASNRKRDFVVWALGLVLGAIGGGALVAHPLLTKLKAAYTQQIEILNTKSRELGEKDAQIAALGEQLESLRTPEAETTAYTLLYEFDAQPSPSSPLELLNLFKPGLGTALAGLKSPTEIQQIQTPGQHPRWLVPGFVKPIFNGEATHARYVWLDASTGKRDVFAPRGTIVQ